MGEENESERANCSLLLLMLILSDGTSSGDAWCVFEYNELSNQVADNVKVARKKVKLYVPSSLTIQSSGYCATQQLYCILVNLWNEWLKKALLAEWNGIVI